MAKQHIKILVKLTKFKATIIVIDQTHRLNSFGNNPAGSFGYFTASNGVRLASVGSPSLSMYRQDWDGPLLPKVYVRGGDIQNDFKPIEIDIGWYPAVKKAIEEYNAWGEKQ